MPYKINPKILKIHFYGLFMNNFHLFMLNLLNLVKFHQIESLKSKNSDKIHFDTNHDIKET